MSIFEGLSIYSAVLSTGLAYLFWGLEKTVKKNKANLGHKDTIEIVDKREAH